MPSTFYVRATPNGNFAECTYYNDPLGNNPLPGSEFTIPRNAGVCVFQQVDDSKLLLIGATFSTLGGAPTLTSNNFCPANADRAIQFDVPSTFVSTKGVVLLFSDRDVVTNIYPSSDPQVTNDGIMSTLPATPTA